jgi:K(+)-stimulated pyrophosphate-energized sodium pump
MSEISVSQLSKGVRVQNMDLVYTSGIVAVLTLGYVGYLIVRLRGFDEGEERIRQLSAYVREGAEAFLRRQYLVVSVFLLGLFVILLLMSLGGLLSPWAPWAFLTAGAFSGLAGYLGMKIATASNGRTTTAAKQSLNRALRVAFEAGSVMGFAVVGLGLFYITLWFVILHSVGVGLPEIAQVLLTSAMGASSVALFARVGGGIFTKSADVGADLSGKVEAGIPEDDPRNPAVVADQVGDNVGDVAGMGADLYESYVGAIVAAVALGVSAFANQPKVYESVAYPMLIAAIGIICSVFGSFLVQTREDASQGELLKALRRGVYTSSALIAIFAFIITVLLFGLELLGLIHCAALGAFRGDCYRVLGGVLHVVSVQADPAPERYGADKPGDGHYQRAGHRDALHGDPGHHGRLSYSVGVLGGDDRGRSGVWALRDRHGRRGDALDAGDHAGQRRLRPGR